MNQEKRKRKISTSRGRRCSKVVTGKQEISTSAAVQNSVNCVTLSAAVGRIHDLRGHGNTERERVCVFIPAEEVEQWQWGCTDLQSSCRVGTVPYFDLLMDSTSSCLLPPPAKKKGKKGKSWLLSAVFASTSSFSPQKCAARLAALCATDYSLDLLSLSHSFCCFAHIFHCLSFMLYLPPFWSLCSLRLVQRTLLEKHQQQPDVKGIQWEWEELSIEENG